MPGRLPGSRPRASRKPVYRIFTGQFAGLLAIVGLLSWHSSSVAMSFFLGGLIQLVPNLYFAWRVFRFSGAAAAHRVTQSFYRGEMVKFVLTGVGFALVFSLVDAVNPPAIFAGYGVMILSYLGLTHWFNH